MRLYLMRHGQTPANVAGEMDTVAPGRGLTELGRQQAEALVPGLAGTELDAVVITDRIRTEETVRPLVRRRELPVSVRPELGEVTGGDYEGRSDAEALRGFGDCMVAWMGGDLDHRMPGGESGREFFDRFDSGIAAAAQAGAGGPVLVVSHGAAIRIWTVCRVDGIDAEGALRLGLANTGCVIIEGSPEAGWTLVDWHPGPLGGDAVRGDPSSDVTGAAPSELREEIEPPEPGRSASGR